MSTELNHDDVATQLVYLVAGIELEAAKYRVTQRLLGNEDEAHPIMSSGGHIGMVADLLPYAKMVSAHIATLEDFPGVYEYQVTECLGVWLAKDAEDKHKHYGMFLTPSTMHQFKEQLLELTTEFLKDN